MVVQTTTPEIEVAPTTTTEEPIHYTLQTYVSSDKVAGGESDSAGDIIIECNQNICFNGGSCFIITHNEFVCFCPPTFSGELCQFCMCSTRLDPTLSICFILFFRLSNTT